MKKLFFTLLFMGIYSLQAFAYSDAEISRVKYYGAALGRAAACNILMENEVRQVAAWMEANFGADALEMEEVFVQEFTDNVSLQKSGQTDESCTEVLNIVSKISWPAYRFD